MNTNIDQETGEVFGRNDGVKNHVSFSPDLVSAITDTARQISLHHNRPGSASFSGQDLFMLNEYRGMSEMWAHGHNGSSYYAKLGERLCLWTIPMIQISQSRPRRDCLRFKIAAQDRPLSNGFQVVISQNEFVSRA